MFEALTTASRAHPLHLTLPSRGRDENMTVS